MTPPATPSPRAPLTTLAAVAIIGQIVLLASALLLPLVSEYRLIGDNTSELVLGRYGWVQTLAFIAGGVGTLALAYALRQLSAGTWGSRVGSVLVGIYGAGAILVALFPTDRIDSPDQVWAQSTTGMIHIAISTLSFVCMIVAMFVLFRTFRLDARWRPLTPWIVLLPCAAFSLFFAQGEGPWVGLLQRMMVGVISAWIVIVALRVQVLASGLAITHNPSPEVLARERGFPRRWCAGIGVAKLVIRLHAAGRLPSPAHRLTGGGVAEQAGGRPHRGRGPRRPAPRQERGARRGDKPRFRRPPPPATTSRATTHPHVSS